jgi:hypothetical protein
VRCDFGRDFGDNIFVRDASQNWNQYALRITITVGERSRSGDGVGVHSDGHGTIACRWGVLASLKPASSRNISIAAGRCHAALVPIAAPTCPSRAHIILFHLSPHFCRRKRCSPQLRSHSSRSSPAEPSSARRKPRIWLSPYATLRLCWQRTQA